MRGFLSVMRKEFRHMLRDPWALATVTVGAMLLMVLLAYTLSADIEHVPMAVLDGDRSPQSRAYLERFANDEFFDLKYWAPSYEEVSEWVESGQVRAAIIIPPGFAEATQQQGERAPIQIVVDGTEPNTAHQILGNAEALSASFSAELLERRLSKAGLAVDHEALPLEFRMRALYNPDLKEINSILPGLMAIVLAMPALSAALSLAREKEQGSLEGLMATPIRRYQLLAGKIVPYLLIGLLDIFFFTLIGLITFGVPFRGHLVDLVFFSGLFLLANMGISLLISSLVGTQMAALLIAGLIFTMPPINESGIFYPLYAMPPDARMQALLWPATHYVIIARGIFLKGTGMQVLMPQGLFLLASGLVLNSLAVWRLKKKLA
ncbi:MAG: ABC transporter permease [Anaerolineae bacterium]|nr:ABC transporter permease [Anaerolineae bacterium]